MAAAASQTITDQVAASATTGNWTVSVATVTATDGTESYNVSVTVTPAALDAAASDFYDLMCIDLGTSSFTLSEDKSSMRAFHFEIGDKSDAATFVAHGTTARVDAGAAATYTNSSTTYNHGLLASQTGVATLGEDATATAYTFKYSALTEANRNSIGFPMSNATGYYACWLQMDLGTALGAITTAADLTVSSSAWTGRGNLTIGAYGAAVVAGFAATLAYAF